MPDDQLVERIVARAVKSSGVKEIEGRPPPDRSFRNGIARRSGDGRDDGSPRPRYPIEQRGLADVRPPDDHDGWNFAQDEVSLSLDSVSSSIYASYRTRGDSKH